MHRTLACLLALGLTLAASAALAGLDGRWTFSYRTPDGQAVSVPVHFADDGPAFSANATYPLGGEMVTDVIAGTVAPTGRVEFGVERQGQMLPHRGQLSRDGRVVRGWYSEPAGPGTFILDRGPMAAEYPILTGEWTYVFQEPGRAGHAADCSIRSLSSGRFTGRIRYRETGAVADFEGTVDRQGTLRFVMHEAGRDVVHTGTVSRDRAAIEGRWHADWSSGSFTITRK